MPPLAYSMKSQSGLACAVLPDLFPPSFSPLPTSYFHTKSFHNSMATSEPDVPAFSTGQALIHHLRLSKCCFLWGCSLTPSTELAIVSPKLSSIPLLHRIIICLSFLLPRDHGLLKGMDFVLIIYF